MTGCHFLHSPKYNITLGLNHTFQTSSVPESKIMINNPQLFYSFPSGLVKNRIQFYCSLFSWTHTIDVPTLSITMILAITPNTFSFSYLFCLQSCASPILPHWPGSLLPLRSSTPHHYCCCGEGYLSLNFYDLNLSTHFPFQLKTLLPTFTYDLLLI